MAIDAFEPRSLNRAIEIRKRPYSWYRDTYYRPNPEGVRGNRTIDQDVRTSSARMAPLQDPNEPSRMLSRDNFAMGTVQIPYLKPGKATTAEELLKQREPGANLYAERDLVQAAQRRIGRDIEDLDDAIDRRVEYMASQGMITGVTPLVNVGDDGVPSVKAAVTWGLPDAHLITLTSTHLWTHADSDPLGNLRTWQNLPIAAVGLSPTIATVGSEVASAILKHAKLQALLDNRRIEAGMLEVREQSINGITYLGRLKGVDFYEDARTYTDDAGSAAYYTPVDRIVLGCPAASAENFLEYGPISDLKCPNPRVARWVKTWEKEEPSVRMVAVHSSPLPALWMPASFVSIKAV